MFESDKTGDNKQRIADLFVVPVAPTTALFKKKFLPQLFAGALMCLGADVALAGKLQTVMAGSCPGKEIVTIANATPRGSVAILQGTREGTETIPRGECKGTEVDLADPKLVSVVTADAKGGFAVTILDLPAKACGRVLQAVDLQTCEVGNAVHVVSGYPAPVPSTGQILSYAPGDDGDLTRGVAWPKPRFTDNGNGTVTDNLTGLIWLKDAECFGLHAWEDAVAVANELAAPACGLSDSSVPGDWRLPNVRELYSLVDFSRTNPSVPIGSPFIDVQWYEKIFYWTSTTVLLVVPQARGVIFSAGHVDSSSKERLRYVWPVRGGR